MREAVGRQPVEADEVRLLGGAHPHVGNVEQRVGGADEAVHVALVREEDPTDGVEQDVVAGVGGPAQRRYRATAERDRLDDRPRLRRRRRRRMMTRTGGGRDRRRRHLSHARIHRIVTADISQP